MNFDKKSLLIVVGIFALFLLVVSIFSISAFPRSQQSSKVANEGNTGTVSNTFPPGNSSPTTIPKPPLLIPQGSVPSTWIREEDPEYAVAYPPSWHSWLLSAPGTTLYIAVVPKTATDEDIFPRLDIMFYSSRNTSIQTLLNQETSIYNKYSTTGSLRQMSITFQGISATQLTGIIKGSAYIQGNPQHKDVIKTFIFFQKGKTTYVVDDAYYNDDQAAQNKQLLLQILATMNVLQ